MSPLRSTGAAARTAALGASAETVFVLQRPSNDSGDSLLRAHDPATGAVRWQRTAPYSATPGP